MDQKKLKVEPAGNTEGDWLAATPSSTELPEYVEGEFDQLIKQEEAEDSSVETPVNGPEAVEEEEDELVLLEYHMNELLEAGGKESFKQKFKRGVSSSAELIRRATAPLGGSRAGSDRRGS